MPAIITSKFRTHNASQFLESFSEAAPNVYYLGIGTPQAFATETTYNPNAIGSHACWKFLGGPDLAHHFENHLRESWAMSKALRDQAN